MFSGGMNLITSYTDVVSISRPLSMHRLATRAASPFGAEGFNAGSPTGYDEDANSTATINPDPRTSTMIGPTSGSLRRLFNDASSSSDLRDSQHEPTAGMQGEIYRAPTFSNIFSSSNASTTATAAAHETALPAYVPPCDAG